MSPYGPDVDGKAQQRGRRGFIKLLTSLGVSASAAAGLSQSALADLDVSLDKEVPFVARKRHKGTPTPGEPLEREPVFETVDRDRWERSESAKAALDEVRQEIERNFGSDADLLTPWIKTLDDGTKLIEIDYEKHHEPHAHHDNDDAHGGETVHTPDVSFEAVERALPGKLSRSVPGSDGLSAFLTGSTGGSYEHLITVTERETTKLMGSCKRWYFNDVYEDGVPGGCKIENGSACTPASDPNDDWSSKMISAAHVLNGAGPTVRQPGKGAFVITPNQVGEVEKTVANGDFGLMAPPEGKEALYEWKLASDSGGYKDGKIEGTVRSSQLEYAEDDIYNDFDPLFKKQGSRTGVTEGEISRFNGNDFTLDANAFKGDSGGPVFERRGSGGIYIAGVNYGGGSGDCPYNHLGATAIEYVEDELEVVV